MLSCAQWTLSETSLDRHLIYGRVLCVQVRIQRILAMCQCRWCLFGYPALQGEPLMWLYRYLPSLVQYTAHLGYLQIWAVGPFFFSSNFTWRTQFIGVSTCVVPVLLPFLRESAVMFYPIQDWTKRLIAAGLNGEGNLLKKYSLKHKGCKIRNSVPKEITECKSPYKFKINIRRLPPESIRLIMIIIGALLVKRCRVVESSCSLWNAYHVNSLMEQTNIDW